MKIAIQAADLDHNRIDGTRVYLLNLLRHFGKISPNDEFLIYHRKNFNSELTPPELENYKIKKADFPFLWTQTRFAWEIWKDNPDALWMPMHNLPAVKRNDLKTIVTIHDLAFKYFPDHFPKKDLFKLNFLAGQAIKNADKIIAVSQSTKKDILKFYPKIKEEKIKVIYHGFDAELFHRQFPEEKVKKILTSYKLQVTNYILYVGAIQPRKNLETLIKAFELYKKELKIKNYELRDLKLVLAGGKAWMWESTIEKIKKSPFKKDIILTGKISFEDLAVLYKNAGIFIFPSLYEGFGIPILEAFASGVPVICARNSSLSEVGGKAAEYFKGSDAEELRGKIEKVLSDKELQNLMIIKGKKQIEKFSWEKCARETLEWIKSQIS
ncbi:glycosyltransferase family 4 protein [bacterium]|nr:glycosyltransferase family 4 protein [bacterium]